MLSKRRVVVVVLSEKVIDGSGSQFSLLMSVSRGGLRDCIQLIGLAVLSGGTLYPGKKKVTKGRMVI